MRAIVLGLCLSVLSLSASEIYASFNVEAQKSANLAFIASGIVNSVKVDVGSSVKTNDILATLENSDIEAILESSKTTLEYAKKDFDRQTKIKKLIDEGTFDSYAYKYENAKNQLAYQQSLFNKTFLQAPFDGVIYEKAIEVGDAVSGMMLKTVFKIQSEKKRKLVLSFDQKYNKQVVVGQTFKYKVDGDETVYQGVISKVIPHANANNRKVQAEVEAEGFMVGLFGDGTIITSEK
ncbi:MAG: efflux RND transporter periplasmic adaptor subunit [Epsilonproteobacteria bacterium]|nr:efflux RND transporter periplasmic adaptor subunit [Campylobacterota bacterium]OIO18134.1 MAG: efflux transporter periplasmic adaptor subunit [Helicobacteraceae bacterium CG1_02_36_14]PIP11161.1 MAG: efflux transporter periplasmic adaptor subunit [Sulfurimonas sp. CG23_combo_of_CG06-09_8_20_14_all_36_33]PIS23698.1 MAG: efflux transporter periplasmic adaptor subunit [Sulfurimonas sp. CG08_land_8_20_14_0_20_36_33]PIU35424.1 MAG: efflux transporter periplasmic adaptor subunit [Sulfurimonas sp. 